MSEAVLGFRITVSGADQAQTSTKAVGQAFEQSGQQAVNSFSKTRAGLESISSQLASFGDVIKGYFAATQLFDLGKSVIATADQYTSLQARLRLASTSQLEFNNASAGLYAIAQKNGAPLEETITLYNKLAPALRELGGTQAQAMQMADLVAKSLRLSGASAAESSSAMLQFSQALGSGVLRGDEFNSLMENSPRLMKAVADGMNVPIGALRNLATEGKLTAESVANALLSQNDVLTAEVGKMPMTVSAAWQKMSNAVTQEIGKLNQASGGTSMLSDSISKLADNVSAVEGALVSAAKVGAVVFIASMVAVRTEAIAAAGMAGIGALRMAYLGLVTLAAAGGAESIIKGILGIGVASTAATPPVLTLSAALKGLIWPVALGYALYEFASYAEKNFLSVRLGIIALAETFQKGVAIISHPLDSKARDAAIAQIKADNSAIAQALIDETHTAPKQAVKAAPKLQGTQAIRDYETNFTKKHQSDAQKLKTDLADEEKAYELALASAQRNNKTAAEIDKLRQAHISNRADITKKDAPAKVADKTDPFSGVSSALDSIKMDVVKAQIASYGMAAEQVKVYELALKGSNLNFS